MRYYSIVITDPVTGELYVPNRALAQGVFQKKPFVAGQATYSSAVGNRTLSAALNIELDVPVYPFAIPMGAGYVRVWGISLQEISQASDLNGKNISVYAGMYPGLPLATAAYNDNQTGLIFSGMIQQAFGNWVGTDQTLDFIVQASLGTNDVPRNISPNWKAGTPLSQAVDQTLATAFPEYARNISISPNLVLANDEPGFYGSLLEYARYLKQISLNIFKSTPTYQGVDVVLREKTIFVYDGTTQTAPKQLKFQDLIGQPTWIESPLIQVRLIMRSDLGVGSYIKLPNTVATTAQSALNQYRSNSIFQGTFVISRLRHVGNFRQPDGNSWNTTIDAYPALAA